MSADIGPKSWVQCTTDDDQHPVHHVRAGTVYYCEELRLLQGFEGQRCSHCKEGAGGRFGLALLGVTNPAGAWCPCIFRPLGGNAVAEQRAGKVTA